MNRQKTQKKFSPEEVQIDLTGNLYNKHPNSFPFILVAVDKNSRWPVAKFCKITNHDTVVTFLREYINVYGVSKIIESDNGSAFFSKEYKNFSKETNIIRKYGTPNLHTGAGLFERVIQSLKNLIKTNLEDIQKLREKLTIGLCLPFSCTLGNKENPFELHFGREPGTNYLTLKKLFLLIQRNYQSTSPAT